MSKLSSAGIAARFAGTLLLTAAMVRFLYVAVTSSYQDDQVPSESLTKPSSAFPVRSGSPSGAPAPASAGKPVRTKLLVSVGAERSTVRVDGAPMGQTPLVTEYSCREGDVVNLEVVEPSGASLKFERICVPGTIRVER